MTLTLKKEAAASTSQIFSSAVVTHLKLREMKKPLKIMPNIITFRKRKPMISTEKRRTTLKYRFSKWLSTKTVTGAKARLLN